MAWPHDFLIGVNVVLENTRNMTKKDAKKVEKDAEEWAEEFEDFLELATHPLFEWYSWILPGSLRQLPKDNGLFHPTR